MKKYLATCFFALMLLVSFTSALAENANNNGSTNPRSHLRGRNMIGVITVIKDGSYTVSTTRNKVINTREVQFNEKTRFINNNNNETRSLFTKSLINPKNTKKTPDLKVGDTIRFSGIESKPDIVMALTISKVSFPNKIKKQ